MTILKAKMTKNPYKLVHIPPNRLDSSPRTIWRPYGAGIHTFCNFLGCFWVKIGHFGHFWLTLEFRRVHHPRRQRVSLDPSKTSQNTPLRSQGVIGIRKSDIWLPKKALTLLQNMKTNRGWINRPIDVCIWWIHILKIWPNFEIMVCDNLMLRKFLPNPEI